MSETTLRRAAGVGLAIAILAVFALTRAFYTQAFADPVTVTLKTDRAGLVMDPGNKVKLRGIEIGKVADVRRVDDGVELELHLEQDAVERVPVNVTARITASTVFGAKFVDLRAPEEASARTVEDGSVIDNSGVTTEVNTVFKSLNNVLRTVDVSDVNTTLHTLARALDGRGDNIATLAATASNYLAKLEPLLPQLRTDLRHVARLARLGEEVSPALIRILDNATATSRTVSSREEAVSRLLVDVALLGEKATKVLGINDEAIIDVLDSLRPTTESLAAYSVELPCLLMGLENTREVMAGVIGGTSPGLRLNVGIRSELEPYSFPESLPPELQGTGPSCSGLPFLDPSLVPFPEPGGQK